MSYKNKIIYGGNVLIDLTSDTAEQSDVLSGATFHSMTGEKLVGTCTYDSDTQDATARAGEILSGSTAYARGAEITGTMPNNGAVTGSVTTVGGYYTIPQGYHDGSGKVGLSADDKSKLIASNIRENITVLGITGTMSASEGETSQDSKTVTPTSSAQTILPDSGYTCLRQVVVNKIPYAEELNSAGGITVTIG